MSYEEVEIILYVQADNQIWLRWFACKICWLAISKSLSWLNCEPGFLEIVLSFCSYSIALRVLIWCLHMWCWTRCFPFLVSICWLNGRVPLNSLPPLLTSCSLGWCQDPAELHSRKGPSLSCNGRSWCRKIGVPHLNPAVRSQLFSSFLQAVLCVSPRESTNKGKRVTNWKSWKTVGGYFYFFFS